MLSNQALTSNWTVWIRRWGHTSSLNEWRKFSLFLLWFWFFLLLFFNFFQLLFRADSLDTLLSLFGPRTLLRKTSSTPWRTTSSFNRKTLSFHEIFNQLFLIGIRWNIRMAVQNLQFFLWKNFLQLLFFLNRFFMFMSDSFIEPLIFLWKFILMSCKLLFLKIIAKIIIPFPIERLWSFVITSFVQSCSLICDSMVNHS